MSTGHLLLMQSERWAGKDFWKFGLSPLKILLYIQHTIFKVCLMQKWQECKLILWFHRKVPWEWKKLLDFHWELSCGIINVLFLNSNITRKNALNSSILAYCVQSVSGRTEKINQCSLCILHLQFPPMPSALFYERTSVKVFVILHPNLILVF